MFFDNQSTAIAAIVRCPRHFLTGALLGDLSFETGAAEASVAAGLRFMILVDWVLTFPFDMAGFVGPIFFVGLTSGVFAVVSERLCFTLSNAERSRCRSDLSELIMPSSLLIWPSYRLMMAAAFALFIRQIEALILSRKFP